MATSDYTGGVVCVGSHLTLKTVLLSDCIFVGCHKAFAGFPQPVAPVWKLCVLWRGFPLSGTFQCYNPGKLGPLITLVLAAIPKMSERHKQRERQ